MNSNNDENNRQKREKNRVKITIQEIKEASENGTLEEAFGTGTAVGIAYIEEIGMEGNTIRVSTVSPVAVKVNDTLNAIKTGLVEDTFGWMKKVENELA